MNTNIGKKIRLNKISENDKYICIPLDHGFSKGPLSGLDDFTNTVHTIITGKATAIIVHLGMVKFLPPLGNTGLIIHVTGNTIYDKNNLNQVIVSSVDACIANGADAISFQINLSSNFSNKTICEYSKMIEQCDKYGIPTLAMLYIFDENNNISNNVNSYINAIRMLTELGVDLIKIPYINNSTDLDRIIEFSMIPILIAGGEIVAPQKLSNMIINIAKSKAQGICMGRNVFQNSNCLNLLNNIRKEFGLK